MSSKTPVHMLLTPSCYFCVVIALSGWIAGCFNLGTKTTTYYAPVLNRSEDKVAYVKRVSNFRLLSRSHVGQEFEFESDEILLCYSRIDFSDERCVESWSLPPQKIVPSRKGEVYAQVNWQNEDKLVYRIRLTGLGPTNLGINDMASNEEPSRLLTNTPVEKPFPLAPTSKDWRVDIDQDPNKFAYPINNKILFQRLDNPSNYKRE